MILAKNAFLWITEASIERKLLKKLKVIQRIELREEKDDEF